MSNPNLDSRWELPDDVRTFGAKLMEQQLWCWGRDVLHEDGNLLMRFGFTRHRDRETEDRCTCYRLGLNDVKVVLWPFGLFYSCQNFGGVFLDRFDFHPNWTLVENLNHGIHHPNQLPAYATPNEPEQWHCAHELLKRMTLWIFQYESWVLQTTGDAYRRECVETWLRPFVHANQMAAAWQFLGNRSWEQMSQTLPDYLQRFTIHGIPT